MGGFTKTPAGSLAVQRRKVKALQILGLDARKEYTVEQVKSQFAELAKAGHPDANDEIHVAPTNLNDLRHAKDFLVKYLGESDD